MDRFRCTLALAAALLSPAVLGQGIDVPQPSRGLMPNPAQGKTLFEQHCAECHGARLDGSKQGPPLLHKYYVPSHHSDASFQLAVKSGSRQHHWNFGDMKPVPGLSPDDVAHITAFVRMQQRRAGIY